MDRIFLDGLLFANNTGESGPFGLLMLFLLVLLSSLLLYLRSNDVMLSILGFLVLLIKLDLIINGLVILKLVYQCHFVVRLCYRLRLAIYLYLVKLQWQVFPKILFNSIYVEFINIVNSV